MEKIKVIFFYCIVVSLLCTKAGYPASEQKSQSNTVDQTPPRIELISPQEGFAVEGGKKLALVGKITDDVGLKTIKIYNGKDYTEYGVSGKEIDLSRYSVDLTQRTFGRISIGVYASDMSGKSSNKLVSVEVSNKYGGGDKGGPLVNLTSPSVGQVVASGKVRLAGTATDENGLKSIEISNGVKSETYVVSGKKADLSNYSVNFTGLAGIGEFMVSAYSVSGKRGYTHYYLNIPGEGDRFPPVISIYSPVEGETVRGMSEIKLRGTVTDDVGLRIIDIYSSGMMGLSPVYNVSGKSIDLSNYPVDISAMKGKGNITIKAFDTAGRVSLKNINLNVIPPDDRFSPVVNLTYPINGQTIQAGKITFKGTVTDDVNLKLIAFTALWGSEESKKVITKSGPYRISGRKVDLSNYSLDLSGFEGQAQVGIGVDDASGKRTYSATTVIVKQPRGNK